MTATTPPDETDTSHRTISHTRRRTAWVIATAVVLILAGAATGWAWWASNQPQLDVTPATQLSTVPVTTGDMVAQTNVAGTLQYAYTLPVIAGIAGTVTEIPALGATATPGGVLYRVDTRPVVLMRGSVPVWRDFSSGMTNGDDVRQLESNLKDFGFFPGDPDTRFTWDTTVAVRAWQKTLGLEATGTVNRAQIVFADQDLRVNTTDARVGAVVGEGAPLFSTTGLQQLATVDMKSADRGLAAPGTAVKITLPTGAEIDGTVATTGAPTAKPNASGNGTSIIVPVTISLASQDQVAGLALSSVTVRFASTLREDVLTVPIDALIPLDDTRFAVETPTTGGETPTTKIPVSVGSFASGNVEISGEGITAGLKVVVPAR